MKNKNSTRHYVNFQYELQKNLLILKHNVFCGILYKKSSKINITYQVKYFFSIIQIQI